MQQSFTHRTRLIILNHSRAFGRLSGLLLLALFLAGCAQENELILYQGEAWEFKSSFTYNPDEMPTMGFSFPIVPGLSLDAGTSLMNPAMTEMIFDELVAHYRQYGFDVSWRKRERFGGDITYTLTAQGVGWHRLADLLDGVGPNEFDLPTPTVQIFEQGDGVVQFIADYPADLYGLSYLLVPTTMRLKGSRILQSNAREVQGGTAVWHNPTGTLQATLKPATPQRQLILLVGVGIGMLVLVSGGGLWLLQKGNRPGHHSPGRPPARRTPPQKKRPPSKRSRIFGIALR
jgi:hypothetical protein